MEYIPSPTSHMLDCYEEQTEI